MRADSIRCSTMFTQVAASQLTEPKIKAGWGGSDFLQALDGAKGRAGEDPCVLLFVFHSVCHNRGPKLMPVRDTVISHTFR